MTDGERDERMIRSISSAGVLALVASFHLQAGEYFIHTFKKLHLEEHFWAEGAHYGDFNRDGHMDLVYGPFWYEGPDFKQRHQYAPAEVSHQRKLPDGGERTVPGYDPLHYSKNFFAFTHDMNGNGWTDILIVGFPGEETAWYENPQGRSGHWKRHVAFTPTDNESPTFADLTGDGKPELICNSGGHFGYARPDWSAPAKPWTFHPISPKGPWQRYTHGLGIGDVNGNGRMDLLEAGGWWEHPASLEGNPVWKRHEFPFGLGGAQMFAYDVNGNGLNDVITSLVAHGFGLAWYEQTRQNSQISFNEHIFMNKEPSENRYGVKFSQLHAIDLVDMDGDGLKDIITGKRFWAHGPKGDPEPNAPAVLYWFKLVRNSNGEVDYIPYLIDDDSGVGTQVVAGDVSGNGAPDVIVGNKKGLFLFLHEKKSVSRQEWEKAQPRPFQ
jgi:hypothetical protein